MMCFVSYSYLTTGSNVVLAAAVTRITEYVAVYFDIMLFTLLISLLLIFDCEYIAIYCVLVQIF